MRYRLDGVITTVDAVNGMDTLDRQFESVKQAAVADRLLLTKVDLAEAEAVERLEQRFLALNPTAPILYARQGDDHWGESLNGFCRRERNCMKTPIETRLR